ncbi:hypothetical protein ACWCQN_12875 [Streptomyces sp. NPDC001984]
MTALTRTEHVADAVTADFLKRELVRITGRTLAEVRITRTRWDDGSHWVAMALTVDRQAPWDRREIPLTEGAQHHEIAILIRDAFPHANWARAQDYAVATGILSEHLVRLPACLRGDDL